MNDLKIFTNEQFGSVRTVEINGEPWLVGKDVAEALGYTNPSKAIADHVDSEDKLNNESLSSIGQRGGWLINESGVYSLVFSSKLPDAKKFKHWVTSEVLPSIRKHGMYATDELLANPDFAIQVFQQLKEEREARKLADAKAERLETQNAKLRTDNSRLEVENQVMLPKSQYFDSLVERNLLTNFRTTAQEFGMSQKEFINFLIEKKFLYRDARHGTLKPYASRNNGYFEVKEFSNDKTGHVGTQTLITPKGREAFRLMVNGA